MEHTRHLIEHQLIFLTTPRVFAITGWNSVLNAFDNSSVHWQCGNCIGKGLCVICTVYIRTLPVSTFIFFQYILSTNFNKRVRRTNYFDREIFKNHNEVVVNPDFRPMTITSFWLYSLSFVNTLVRSSIRQLLIEHLLWLVNYTVTAKCG